MDNVRVVGLGLRGRVNLVGFTLDCDQSCNLAVACVVGDKPHLRPESADTANTVVLRSSEFYYLYRSSLYSL